jgi:hypothetical protein
MSDLKKLQDQEKNLRAKCDAAFKDFQDAQKVADDKRDQYREAKSELAECQKSQTQLLVAKLKSEGKI